MSSKITSILILLSCLNITLADNDCTGKIKLYTEQEYSGNFDIEIINDKRIKDIEVKSLIVFGNCKWDMYRY